MGRADIILVIVGVLVVTGLAHIFRHIGSSVHHCSCGWMHGHVASRGLTVVRHVAKVGHWSTVPVMRRHLRAMSVVHHLRMGHVSEWDWSVRCHHGRHVLVLMMVMMLLLGTSLGRPVNAGANGHLRMHVGVTMAVHTVRHVWVMTHLAHRHGLVVLMAQST